MDGSEWPFAAEPAHPGDILKHDILPELNISVAELADRLGYERAAVSDLLNGKKRVSTRMAIRLGKAFKNGARFWLALQAQRDIWEEEKREEHVVLPFEWKGDAA